MDELSKTIKDLEDWINCPLAFDSEIDPDLVHRVYELLKEQKKTIESLEDELAMKTDMLNHYLNGNE